MYLDAVVRAVNEESEGWLAHVTVSKSLGGCEQGMHANDNTHIGVDGTSAVTVVVKEGTALVVV